MGMHDGEFSTAHLAGLLGVPVLLVVDAYGMAESAGAIVKGFSEFGVRRLAPAFTSGTASAGCAGIGVRFAGVLFNRVASENHYKRLKDSVQDIPVLGYLPRELNFEIPHRHLGLTVAEEKPLSNAEIRKACRYSIKTCRNRSHYRKVRAFKPEGM